MEQGKHGKNDGPGSGASIFMIGCGGPVALYALAYVVARLTHTLVYYSSGRVMRPYAMTGWSLSWAEIIFAPLIALEEAIR